MRARVFVCVCVFVCLCVSVSVRQCVYACRCVFARVRTRPLRLLERALCLSLDLPSLGIPVCRRQSVYSHAQPHIYIELRRQSSTEDIVQNFSLFASLSHVSSLSDTHAIHEAPARAKVGTISQTILTALLSRCLQTPLPLWSTLPRLRCIYHSCLCVRLCVCFVCVSLCACVSLCSVEDVCACLCVCFVCE